MIWSLLHWSLTVPIPMSLRTALCIRQNSFKTQRRDNWWPDQVFKDYDVTYVISFISRRWLHLLLLNSFSRQYFNKYITSRPMSLLEMSIRQHVDILQKTSIPRSVQFSVVVMLREMQREINTGRPFESRLHIDYYTKITFLSFALQAISITTTWLFSHDGNHLDQELWEHCGAIRVSDSRITRKVRPENVDNPMIVSEDYDVRQSGRFLELQSRDLCIRSTDLSWHFPILMTIYECPSEITVEGYPRRWRSERTRSRKSRSRRLWKTETRIGIQANGNRLGRGLLILIFIFCVTRMELRSNAWAFWLTITSRLEELRPDAWAFWLAVSWFGQLRSSAWGYDMTVALYMAMRSSS